MNTCKEYRKPLLSATDIEVAADLTRELMLARTPVELEFELDTDQDLCTRHMLLVLLMNSDSTPV